MGQRAQFAGVGAIGVLLLLSSLAVPTCGNDGEESGEVSDGSSLPEGTIVRFAIHSSPSELEQRGYQLTKVLLRAADGDKAGLPTRVWGQVKYATLVFQCFHTSAASACADFDPAAASVTVSRPSVDGDLEVSQNGATLNYEAPRDEDRAERVRLAIIVEAQRQALEAGEPSQQEPLPPTSEMEELAEEQEYLGSGRFAVTVPIEDLVDINDVLGPVSITLGRNSSSRLRSTVQPSFNRNGDSEPSEGALEVDEESDESNAEGECTKRSDCCPDGVEGCTQVCTFGNQCRGGECEEDSECPSGNCNFYKCVECSEKEDCPAGQFCDRRKDECLVGECHGDADCPCNSSCDVLTDRCESADCNPVLTSSSCSADCETDETCELSFFNSGVFNSWGCRQKDNTCGSQGDCAEGTCCNGSYWFRGTCEPCECQWDPHCGPSSYCTAGFNGGIGECKPGCWADEQCPGCTYCNTETHECEDILVAGVKQECPPGCDNANDGSPEDGGGTCFLADGSHGTCCEPGICLGQGCGGQICPDGRVECLGECCDWGDSCTPGVGCDPPCPSGQAPCGDECCADGYGFSVNPRSGSSECSARPAPGFSVLSCSVNRSPPGTCAHYTVGLCKDRDSCFAGQTEMRDWISENASCPNNDVLQCRFQQAPSR